MSYQWIKASEIGEYLYCQRAWWLKRELGVSSQNIRALEVGQKYHQTHGHLVFRARYGRQVALVLLFLAALIAIWQMAGGG
jgi:CRISPR/Cas system-associated exonuclease Cas4 (RecB family)